MFLVVSVMMSHVGTDDLERLGRYITGRRVALGHKHRAAFAKRIDLSDRLLADVENGVRRVGAGSYAILENALGWRPGSIAAIIRGGEPIEGDAQLNLTNVPIDDLLGEIRRRVVSAGGNYPKTYPGAAGWRQPPQHVEDSPIIPAREG